MPTATEALQLLVDRRFSVVPLHNPDMNLIDLPPHVRKRVDPAGKEYSERDIGKIPLVTGWKDEQKRLPTEAMTEKRWKEWPIANIAVVCGEVSDIFVVDADGEAPLGFMERLGIVPGLTLTAKTGRPSGYQFYFRWPGFEVSNNLGQIFAGLDIKGEGGYVCFTAGHRVVVRPQTWWSQQKRYKGGMSTKDISAVLPGDILQAYDDASGRIVETTVQSISRRIVHSTYIIKFGAHQGTLRVTGEHPLYTSRGWVLAQDLRAGDCLFHVEGRDIGLHTGIPRFRKNHSNPHKNDYSTRPYRQRVPALEVTFIQELVEDVEVFNIHCEPYHTYFIRRQDKTGQYVVAHNCAPPSRHRLGVNYAWVDGVDEPMPAPEELLEIIRQAAQRKARKALLPENELNRLLAGPVPDGERHNSAKTLFAHWIGIGMPERAVREAAYTWGQTVCKPPADNEHLQKIVTWALEQESSKRKNPEEPKMAREGDDFIFSWPDFGLRVVMKNLEEDRREVWAEVIIESEVTGRLSWGRLSLPSTSGRDQLRKKLEAIRNDINWVAVLENICFMATEAFREIGEPKVPRTSDVRVDNRDIVDGVIKLSEGTINIIFADMASGKMLALDTPIPMPGGWTTMGELRIGDRIFNEVGRQCSVVGTYDGWANSAYRLHFSDGTSVDACADHQWLTYDILTRSAIRRRVGNRSGRVLPPQSLPRQSAAIRTTEEIVQTLYYRSDKLMAARHSIPMCGPLDMPEADLPIDPYVLGLWLGDGHSAQAVLTTSDQELAAAVGEAGFPVRPRKHRRRGRARGYGILGLQPILRSLGVLDNKHIPAKYLYSSPRQRLALLQGLMDSDGYASGDSGAVEFTSTNESIAAGVIELARSLGQKPVLHPGRAMLYGKDCGPKYRITWSPTIQVFRLPRKAKNLRLAASPTTRLTHRRIVRAYPLPPQPMRCIQVDSPSGLFLAGRGMIPTHNSTLAEAIGIAVATGRPFPGIIVPKRKPLNTLYIDTENMREDDFVLRRVALCKGLGIPEPENLWWFHPARPLMENRQRIKARMDQKNIEFVILDSLAAAAGTGPEKADAAIRMIETLHYLGRTALVIAHLPKAMASNGNSGEARTAYGCYSADTEVLTRSGWKTHDAWIGGEAILCFDPASSTLRWDVPTRKFSYRHRGKLVSISQKLTDILVTPDHRMVVRPNWEEDWHFVPADELPVHQHLVMPYSAPLSEDNPDLESITVGTISLGEMQKGLPRIDYDGMVYCFEVPSGAYLTRRRGKTAIAGNSIFNTAYPRTSWDISVTERTDDRLTVRILHKKINLGKMRRRAYLIFEFKGKGDVPDAILLSTASASQAEPPNTVIGSAPAGTIGTTSWWAKELGVDESVAKARLNDMRREGYVEPTKIGGGRGKQTEWVRTDKPWHETGREGASLDDGESVL